MLHNSVSSSTLLRLIPATNYKPAATLLLPPTEAPSTRVNLHVGRLKTSKRGVSVVTRAGGISSSSYIFAFVLPLSLLAVTIFTSVRIADKLDQKFFEELAVNEAILEADEDGVENENENENESTSSDKESAPIRSRNRPKREVEA
ncbi:uncharacterized protein [Henckelia pumila]|uniref:uncharacterized protein n=1 Tax=Henckelia pumila TaxID=405737 RepID=UPI003C6DFD18